MLSRRFFKATVLVLASVLAISNGWIIKCNFYNGNFGYPGFDYGYVCEGEFIDDGSLDITSVTGILDVGETLADVVYFYTYNNGYSVRTHKIPRTSVPHFRTCEELHGLTRNWKP